MLKRLNICSGDQKIKDYVNVDINIHSKPDIVMNVIKPWPFKSNYFDEAVMFHSIEHIPYKKHPDVVDELYRVLAPGAAVYFSYPEFLMCAEYYKTNYHGDRDFWRDTLYGRQTTPHEFHVSLMDTQVFTAFLRERGFRDIEIKPELHSPYNTIVKARKKLKPVITSEDVLRRSIEDGTAIRHPAL